MAGPIPDPVPHWCPKRENRGHAWVAGILAAAQTLQLRMGSEYIEASPTSRGEGSFRAFGATGALPLKACGKVVRDSNPESVCRPGAQCGEGAADLAQRDVGKFVENLSKGPEQLGSELFSVRATLECSGAPGSAKTHLQFPGGPSCRPGTLDRQRPTAPTGEAKRCGWPSALLSLGRS